MLSFIVPAHNEEFWLTETLKAIHESVREVNQAYEIIVVDDDSTDKTAELARDGNAAVLHVKHRQIAATRNAGARIAQGDRLFFVDADTTINPRAVESALRWMDRGAAGGGAPAHFEGSVPLYARLLLAWLGFFMIDNVWYVSDRKQDKDPSWSDRVSNGIALLILSVLVIIPIWLVPWPQALLNGPLGYVRLGARIILAHTGLVLGPCSLFLLRNLSRPNRRIERIKSTVLIGVCIVIACQATLGVVGFWEHLLLGLAN